MKVCANFPAVEPGSNLHLLLQETHHADTISLDCESRPWQKGNVFGPGMKSKQKIKVQREGMHNHKGALTYACFIWRRKQKENTKSERKVVIWQNKEIDDINKYRLYTLTFLSM